MYRLTVTLCGLLALLAAPTTADTLVFRSDQSVYEVEEDPGQPCCLPTSQTHATLLFGGVLGSGSPPTAFSSPASVAFDNDNYLAAAHGIGTAQDPTANVSLIVDYTAGVMYVAQPKGKQCSSVQLPEGMEGTCIPDDADYTYLGRAMVGYGANTVPVDNFQVPGDQAGVDLTFQAGVMPGSCAPVSITLWGDTGNTQVVAQLSFYNTTAGVKDPSVFKVPSYCQGGPKAAGEVPRMAPTMELLKHTFMVMRRGRN